MKAFYFKKSQESKIDAQSEVQFSTINFKSYTPEKYWDNFLKGVGKGYTNTSPTYR